MSHHKKPVQPAPPTDKLFLRAGNLEDPKCMASLNKAVCHQPFLSQLELLVSTTSPATELPTEIKQIVEEYTFSHARINPAELLCPTFMNTYIRANRSDSLVLVSAGDSSENVLAIDGTGHLILCVHKDTYSILGIPGHRSRYGGDGYYIEVDLKPDYMRSGKSGFERIREGLRKLGELDLIATFVDHKGVSSQVQFPSTALSTQILRPRFTCEASNSSPASKLLDLQEALSNHDFNSEKSRKRKRDGKAVQQSQEQEDTGLLIQGFLEAVTLVDDSPAKSNTGESILRITINGLLHSSLAQILLKQLISSKSHQLISMTAQTMSNAPVHKFIKRDGLSEREKGRRNGQEERAVDDSRILDGWSLIFGRVPDSERTRFVYVDSTPT